MKGGVFEPFLPHIPITHPSLLRNSPVSLQVQSQHHEGWNAHPSICFPIIPQTTLSGVNPCVWSRVSLWESLGIRARKVARLRKFLFSRGKSFYKWFLLEITFFSLSNFWEQCMCVYNVCVWLHVCMCVGSHMCGGQRLALNLFLDDSWAQSSPISLAS